MTAISEMKYGNKQTLLTIKYSGKNLSEIIHDASNSFAVIELDPMSGLDIDNV